MGVRAWTSAQFKDMSQKVAHKTSITSYWTVLGHMATSTLQGRLRNIIFILGSMCSATKESSITMEEAKMRLRGSKYQSLALLYALSISH